MCKYGLMHSKALHCYHKASFGICKPGLGFISTEGPKFAYRVCLKWWDLRTLRISTLSARRQQLRLCTFFSYVNRLSIAFIHRVPPFQSRQIAIWSLLCCPFAHTNQYMYSFFPHTIYLWNNFSGFVVHSDSLVFKHSLQIYCF